MSCWTSVRIQRGAEGKGGGVLAETFPSATPSAENRNPPSVSRPLHSLLVKGKKEVAAFT